jgi:hypothetical protein
MVLAFDQEYAYLRGNQLSAPHTIAGNGDGFGAHPTTMDLSLGGGGEIYSDFGEIYKNKEWREVHMTYSFAKSYWGCGP